MLFLEVKLHSLFKVQIQQSNFFLHYFNQLNDPGTIKLQGLISPQKHK